MEKIYVGKIAEFADRSRKVIAHGENQIGVYRVGEQFYAYHNFCPHAGGPVCQGKLYNRVEEPVAGDKTTGMMRYVEGEVNIVCPWHGHEYDLKTGTNVGNSKLHLRRARLEITGDDVYVLA